MPHPGREALAEGGRAYLDRVTVRSGKPKVSRTGCRRGAEPFLARQTRQGTISERLSRRWGQEMDEQLCMPVEYVYRRERRPKSRLWHMVPRKAAPRPSLMRPGLVGSPEETADEVIITCAVPCDQDGEVGDDAREESEDKADELFNQLRPDDALA